MLHGAGTSPRVCLCRKRTRRKCFGHLGWVTPTCGTLDSGTPPGHVCVPLQDSAVSTRAEKCCLLSAISSCSSHLWSVRAHTAAHAACLQLTAAASGSCSCTKQGCLTKHSAAAQHQFQLAVAAAATADPTVPAGAAGWPHTQRLRDR